MLTMLDRSYTLDLMENNVSKVSQNWRWPVLWSSLKVKLFYDCIVLIEKIKCLERTTCRKWPPLSENDVDTSIIFKLFILLLYFIVYRNIAYCIEFILEFLRTTLLSKLCQIIIIIIYVNLSHEQEQWFVLLYANEHVFIPCAFSWKMAKTWPNWL